MGSVLVFGLRGFGGSTFVFAGVLGVMGWCVLVLWPVAA